jgi:GT2 family glycosyltransferase
MNNPAEFEIILVDNNSTDGTVEFITDLKVKYPALILQLNSKNLGVAGGRNVGFHLASKEFIIALDDDSKIDITDIHRVPNLFYDNPQVGLFAFNIYDPIKKENQNPINSTQIDISNHHGAGFAFRKDLLKTIKGIDLDCNYGAEEFDFAIKIRSIGYKVEYLPSITVLHYTKLNNVGIEKHRALRRIYNNVRLYYKYFPGKMAKRNSARYFIVAVYYWVNSFGIDEFTSLYKTYKEGKKNGLDQHVILTEDLIKFYNNKKLRPDFGNVPLINKIICFLQRSLNF